MQLFQTLSLYGEHPELVNSFLTSGVPDRTLRTLNRSVNSVGPVDYVGRLQRTTINLKRGEGLYGAKDPDEITAKKAQARIDGDLGQGISAIIGK